MADNLRINGASDPWYHYRNVMGVPSRRTFFCGITLIFLILTLVIIAFTFITISNRCCSQKIEKLEKYEAFQSYLNTSIDPCVNFYEFTCGSWCQDNDIPPDEERVTSFSLLQDAVDKKKRTIFENSQVDENLPIMVNNAIKFYAICIGEHRNNVDESKVLVNVLNQIGGWPMLNETSWNEDAFEWTNASAFIANSFNVQIIIQLYLIDEDRNDSKNTFYLKNSDLYDAFGSELIYNQMVLFSALFEMNSSLTTTNYENLQNTEAKWIELFYDKSLNKSDPVTMSVGEFVEKIPEINWFDYLQFIMNDFLLSNNKTISLNDTIVIEDFDYVRKVGRVLSSDTFSKLDLANLFGWLAVKSIWIMIPDAMKRYAIISDFNPSELTETVQRKCYSLILDLFQCCLDYLYIKNSTISGIQDGKNLANYVKSAFNDFFLSSTWLDEVSKNRMLHKLHTMKYIIGFQAYQNNKTEFDKFYENFPIISDNLLKYYFQLNEYFRQLKRWMLPRSVTHVSAYYMLNKNTFVYPISLHNPPFYYDNGPSYLNFGAIGSVIAHEMMHGFGTFDDDTKYQIYNLFSNSSSIYFKKLADCFIDQYNTYDSNELYKNNGTSTLRENIADSEGLRISFEAYKKYEKDFSHKNKYLPTGTYSSDQTFFISYGTYLCSKISPQASSIDTHSFPELRVNGAVSNLEYFASTFNCPKGSPMNPVKKCSIW